MEYPMLITAGTTWWMPFGIRFPEAVTIHEFGHQYWYGMVANNEFEEAWLDEGLNSYVEGRILDEAYGGAGVVISTRYGVREGIKIKAKIGDLEPINAEVVWVIRLDKYVAKIGLRFDDQK